MSARSTAHENANATATQNATQNAQTMHTSRTDKDNDTAAAADVSAPTSYVYEQQPLLSHTQTTFVSLDEHQQQSQGLLSSSQYVTDVVMGSDVEQSLSQTQPLLQTTATSTAEIQNAVPSTVEMYSLAQVDRGRADAERLRLESVPTVTQNTSASDSSSSQQQPPQQQSSPADIQASHSKIVHIAPPPPLTVYYSSDPIEFFRIRVQLRLHPERLDVQRRPKTIKGLNLLLKQKQNMADEGNESKSSTNESEANASTATTSSDVLSQTIDWNEKIYSPMEILTYSNPSFHSFSPLQTNYSSTITSLLSQLYPNDSQAAFKYLASHKRTRLFTMTAEDGFTDVREIQKRAYSTQEKLNPLAERLVDPKGTHKSSGSKKSHIVRDQHFQQLFICTSVDIPTDPLRLSGVSTPSKIRETPVAPSTGQAGFEQVLCSIRYYENGMLEMKPGFSPPIIDPERFEDSEWYEFWTPKGERYRYRIENDSDRASSYSGDQDFPNYFVIDPLRNQLNPANSSLLRIDWEETPKPNEIFYHCMGEFVHLTDFIDRSLFIQYELHLPPGWHFKESDTKKRMKAVSQISESIDWINEDVEDQDHSFYEEKKTAFLGFPFEFELKGNRMKANIAEEPDLLLPFSYPTLYIQVNSVDSLNCHRLMGYAYKTLPSQSGSFSITVPTWKPLGTIRQQLSEYFVGGSILLRDRKFAGLHGDEWEDDIFSNKSTKGNRFGMESETSGNVTLRLEIIVTNSPVVNKK